MSKTPRGLEERRAADGKFGSGRTAADSGTAADRAAMLDDPNSGENDDPLGCTDDQLDQYFADAYPARLVTQARKLEEKRLAWAEADVNARQPEYDYDRQATEFADAIRVMADHQGIDIKPQIEEGIVRAAQAEIDELGAEAARLKGNSKEVRDRRDYLQRRIDTVECGAGGATIEQIAAHVPDRRLGYALTQAPRVVQKDVMRGAIDRRPRANPKVL